MTMSLRCYAWWILSIILLSLVSLSHSTDISSCQAISTSGEYSLNRDIVGNIPAPTFVSHGCIFLNNSNIDISCAGFKVTNNGTWDSFAFGADNYYTNITIRDCTNVTGYRYGAFIQSIGNSTIRNNSFYSVETGIFFSASQSNISNNTVTNISSIGFYIGGDHNVIKDNVADIRNITSYGFLVGESNNVTNNTAYGGGRGFDFYYSTNNILSFNSAFNNQYGIVISDQNTHDNLISNNQIFNNSVAGILLVNTNNQSIRNNYLYNNPIGVYVNHSADNSFTSNILTNLSIGYFINSSINNLFNSNILSNLSIGFSTFNSTFTLSANTINNNSMYGVVLNSSNASFDSDHFYKNGLDILVNSVLGTSTLTANSIIFDDPTGSMENQTTLSIEDSVIQSELYSFYWSGNFSASNYTSIGNKAINISNYSAASIDSLIWHYSDAEANSHVEDGFVILKLNNSSPYITSSTVSTSSNTVSVSSLADFGVFGLFQDNSITAQPSGGGSGNNKKYRFNLDTKDVSCKNVAFEITDSSSGDPVPDARFVAFVGDLQFGPVSSNSKGQVTVSKCFNSFNVDISKSGYEPFSERVSVNCPMDCWQIKCQTNADCSDNDICSENKVCTPLICPKGKPYNKMCVECISNVDCSTDNMTKYSCTNNKCILIPECTNDSGCSFDKKCSDNKCQPIECPNGKLENHQCFPIIKPQCTSDSDCTTNQTCVNNVCKNQIIPKTYEIIVPDKAKQNDSVPIIAKEDTKPCIDCLLKIEGPNLPPIEAKTDASGKSAFGTNGSGQYNITLFKDGRAVQSAVLFVSIESKSDNSLLLYIVGILILLIVGLLTYLILSRRNSKK